MTNAYKKVIIRAVTAILVAAAAFCHIFSFNVSAKEYDKELVTDCVYVFNIESSKAVVQKNAKKKIYPASTVKIMTAILVLEHFGENLDVNITVSKEAVDFIKGGGNVVGFSAGDVVSVRDLVNALIIGGKNDAATALAVAVSGDITAFVKKMNDKAKEIGANDTNYTNPCGIHDSKMQTTAYDVALIAKYAYSIKGYAEMAAKDSCVLLYDNERIYNRNYMALPSSVYYYSAASAINAGNTYEAGYCVVSALKDPTTSLTYIGVMMNQFLTPGDNTIYAYTELRDILRFAKGAYKYASVLSQNKIVGQLPVKYASLADYALVTPENDVVLLMPSDINISSDIEIRYEIYEKRLSAPVEKGTVVGKAFVYHKSELVHIEPLVIKSSIESSDSQVFLYNTFKIFKSPVFWIAVILIFLVFIYFKFIKIKNKAPKNKA